jgi:flagellar basal-body rod protein FlgB
MAFGLASHAAARQSVIAGNVANADTPGYKSHDIAPFSETFDQTAAGMPMRATRASHITFSESLVTLPTVFDAGDEPSPNGNSVSLEMEMVKAAETRQEHELALSIYSSSLNILRTSLGRK